MPYNDSIIPKEKDNKVHIPVTLEYKPGKSSHTAHRLIWVIAAVILLILVDLGLLFNSGSSLLVKIISISLVTFCGSFGLRFIYLNEADIRNEQIAREDNDSKIDTYNFWGIQSISSEEPYICRFRSGRSGIYVKMEKGVFSGDRDHGSFMHKQAMGDFLRFIGENAVEASNTEKVEVTHIDIMDFVGKDERLTLAQKNNTHVEGNELMTETLNRVFSNLQDLAQNNVYTYDIFVFTWGGSDEVALKDIYEGIGLLMRGNYIDYTFMDSTDLIDCYKTLFNVTVFSANDASAKAQGDISTVGIKPIRVVYTNGGSLEINRTREEEEQLREYKRQLNGKKTDTPIEKPLGNRFGYNGEVDPSILEKDYYSYNDDINDEGFKF